MVDSDGGMGGFVNYGISYLVFAFLTRFRNMVPTDR